jgi:hydrogenase nickel incorporation protein HypA/HybF
MHEYSIVASLIDLCEKQLKKAKAKEVKNVFLKIGRLSGVDSHFIQNSFDFFKEDTCCHNAALMIKELDVIIECKACLKRNTVLDNNFYCSSCNSPETSIVQGQEMHVESIEVIN